MMQTQRFAPQMTQYAPSISTYQEPEIGNEFLAAIKE
jgi:hypothetical protein